MTLGTLIWIVIIGGVFYLMMKKGGGCCGGHEHGGMSGHDGPEGSGDKDGIDHSHHHMEAEAHDSKIDKDPVCGMDVKDQRIESSHLGRTFHFCSEQCRKLFDLNPKKYAGA